MKATPLHLACIVEFCIIVAELLCINYWASKSNSSLGIRDRILTLFVALLALCMFIRQMLAPTKVLFGENALATMAGLFAWFSFRSFRAYKNRLKNKALAPIA